MELAIIIPVHNAEKYLDRCMESVLNAIQGLDAKVLLLNDASTDDSWGVMTKYKIKYPKSYIFLRFLMSEVFPVWMRHVRLLREFMIWFIRHGRMASRL